MQITCPECGETVPADHINIQEMAAVCPACHTVFSFNVPSEKIKRRKVKQPRHMDVRESEALDLYFRTNFRLDRSEAFISSAISSLALTVLTVLQIIGVFASDVPPVLPLGFALATLASFYWMALLVYNKTHVAMDADSIRVSREPLPSLLVQAHEINLSGVVAIRCTETVASKQEGYDTPRYRVWAEMADGAHKTIVNDVTDDYGYFIAQRLEERLHAEVTPDTSRLEDNAEPIDAPMEGELDDDQSRQLGAESAT